MRRVVRYIAPLAGYRTTRENWERRPRAPEKDPRGYWQGEPSSASGRPRLGSGRRRARCARGRSRALPGRVDGRHAPPRHRRAVAGGRRPAGSARGIEPRHQVAAQRGRARGARAGRRGVSDRGRAGADPGRRPLADPADAVVPRRPAVVGFATNGSIAVYDQVLFTAHMAGHLALVMVAPALLVGGHPLTLLLTASPPAAARTADEGRARTGAVAAHRAAGGARRATRS